MYGIALAILYLFALLGVFARPVAMRAQTAQYPSRVDSIRGALAAFEQRRSRMNTTQIAAWIETLNQYAMLLHETYPDSTRLFAQQALRLADSLNNDKGKALSLNSIGVSYFIQNNYEKALEYYLQALALRERIADFKGVAGTLNNVGMVYRDMKEYSTALSYYFRALRLNDSLQNTQFLVRNLNNIGAAYESLNRLDSALEYHKRSLDLKRSIGDKSGIAASLRNIGKVYGKMKQYPNALNSLREALQMQETTKQTKAFILLDVSHIYTETRQHTAAMNNALAAMLLARELGSALILQEAHELLAEIHLQTSNHKSALEHYQRFITIRDSLFNEASTRRLAALQTNYEIERQRSQIDLLTKETELRNIVTNALIAGFILSLGLLVLGFIAYSNKQRSNKQLQQTNAEILRQQQLLEEQAEEIQISNTALAENNIALSNANNRLTALNDEKSELMGIVAHDLKNPIGAVRGLADIIWSGDLAQTQVRELSKQITAIAERMLELVKNLLDVNRLESGAMQFSILPTDVQPVVEASLWQYEDASAAKGLTISFVNEASQTSIAVDEQALAQVMDNLISNAVKYSPRGKNIIVRLQTVTVQNVAKDRENTSNIHKQTGCDYLRIAVQDEGPGISSEDMTKLFGKFARLSARPTGGEHSTGLGLSIVKKIVETMNGKVWCESSPGTGATFIVEFPLLAPVNREISEIA